MLSVSVPSTVRPEPKKITWKVKKLKAWFELNLIRFRGVPNFCCFEVCKSGARKHTKIGPLNPPILGQKRGVEGAIFQERP